MEIYGSPQFFATVKLNNPLMGTETIMITLLYPLKTHRLIKLNNPLMGTETMVG